MANALNPEEMLVLMWAGGLTDPEVVEPLAHGAALVGDLVEVLVEAGLQRDEPGQRREVVFCTTSEKQQKVGLVRMHLSAEEEAHGRQAAAPTHTLTCHDVHSVLLPPANRYTHFQRLGCCKIRLREGKKTSLNEVTLAAGLICGSTHTHTTHYYTVITHLKMPFPVMTTSSSTAQSH